MSSWTATTYKTKTWAAYNRTLKQYGSLSLCFDAATDWGVAPLGKQGRQQASSDMAIKKSLPHDQSAVRFALEASHGFCGKPVETDRTELVGA